MTVAVIVIAVTQLGGDKDFAPAADAFQQPARIAVLPIQNLSADDSLGHANATRDAARTVHNGTRRRLKPTIQIDCTHH